METNTRRKLESEKDEGCITFAIVLLVVMIAAMAIINVILAYMS